MNITHMAKRTFEDRLLDMVQRNFDGLKEDYNRVEKKIDENTRLTNSIDRRVGKLEGKVYKKKLNVLTLLQDKQLVGLFLFSLMLFLVILANILKIEVPYGITS